MLNTALVGMGRWGRRLVDSVQAGGTPKGDAIRFVAGVTRSPDKAAPYARTQGLRLSPDFASVLDDPAIDAVVLATPNDQHAQQIGAAIAAGKHVFVEKPFTMTQASAQEAADAAVQAGLVVALGHNRRFLPAMKALKSMIDTGALGQIHHIEGSFSGSFGLHYPPGNWRTEEKGVTGAMTALGIHTVDSFIHLLGKARSVRCFSQRLALEIDMDDTVSVFMRLAGGPSAYLSTMVATSRQWRLQVFGTKGWAHMRDHHILDVSMADAAPKTETFPVVDIERAELEAFAAAAAGQAPYPLSLEDAVHGIAILEAVITSSKQAGKEILLD
ncbi:MAG: Gfo/Idh/MocA family oxidoreductase [Proteobacteria bacterium]|nr:Gfo/Idh/MocA family oxidoreductase [Pseudomonadota bacterium]